MSHRFASHAHLMAFWKQIEPATCKMVRVTRARSVAKNDEVPHTGSATVNIFYSCSYKARYIA